ncbi:hypothetical protein DID99_11865 [Burkholderia sp. Bp8986]|nr:hypothetical protein DID99_11865 [Burkholderia sp. Bp8986]RQZ45643.1 hypothetical protein DIE17_21090 [Burkholderia sp. Bp9099]
MNAASAPATHASCDIEREHLPGRQHVAARGPAPDCRRGLTRRDREAPVSGRAVTRDIGPQDNVRPDRANLRATVYDSAAARPPACLRP